MIIRGTPKNIEDYIGVDSDMTINLHKNGFIPKYVDNNFTYFIKSDKILEFIRKNK